MFGCEGGTIGLTKENPQLVIGITIDNFNQCSIYDMVQGSIQIFLTKNLILYHFEDKGYISVLCFFLIFTM